MHRKSELADIDVIIIHQTEKAILVQLSEDDEEVWLPLSVVEINSRKGKQANISLPESMALERGLI